MKYVIAEIDIDHVMRDARQLGVVVTSYEMSVQLASALINSKRDKIAYYKLGLVLSQIRYEMWYKEKYDTYENFLREVLNISDVYAQRLTNVVNRLKWSAVQPIAGSSTVVKYIAYVKEKYRKPLIAYAIELRTSNKPGKIIELLKQREEELRNTKKREIKTKDELLLLVDRVPKKTFWMKENGTKVTTYEELLSQKLVGTVIPIDDRVGVQVTMKIGGPTFYEFISLEN